MSTEWKPSWAPGLDPKALTLSEDERRLATHLDGQSTAEELALLSGLPRVQVAAALERMVEAGVLAAPMQEPAQPTEPEGTGTASHLAFYRQHFHALSSDERARVAAFASGEALCAMCFDPVPAVIRMLMENRHTGLEQARLVAAHHQNSAGLEFLLARAELMRDPQVQRLLFRNPQLNEGQLRRLTQGKRLLEVWKLSVSREVTTQTRSNTARLLRTRFATAPAEERVELIFSTEGRALGGLSGLPIDAKTTALLCARTYGSMLLVQNLAHWSATPPALIAHLLKQPLVMRQPRLRALVSQHPNAKSAHG